MHPGGIKVLSKVAGTDCTEEFFGLHREEVLAKMGPNLCIGTVEGEEPILTR